jgi:hypothetical protein
MPNNIADAFEQEKARAAAIPKAEYTKPPDPEQHQPDMLGGFAKVLHKATNSAVGNVILGVASGGMSPVVEGGSHLISGHGAFDNVLRAMGGKWARLGNSEAPLDETAVPAGQYDPSGRNLSALIPKYAQFGDSLKPE